MTIRKIERNHMDVIGTCKALALMASITGLSQGHLHTSEKALQHIINLESCRLMPYKCQAGIWTDGIGNTANVKPGILITEQEAAQEFVAHIKHFEKELARLLVEPISQPVWDSLISFMFNVGVNAFKRSTLLSRLQHGQTFEACMEMGRWIYVKKKISKGLQNRRKKEITWCLSGLYDPVHPYEMDVMDLLQELQYYQSKNNTFMLYELASEAIDVQR